MIRFILIPLSIMLSCGSTKTNQLAAQKDSVIVAQPADLNQKDSALALKEINTAIPACMKNKIDSFKLKEPHERPQRVVEYVYKAKKVYLVVMPCCDFFNEVYDDKCIYLGAPDGGFTGKGDGKIPDFYEAATSEKLVWGTPK
jgi:hypothetical protein